jgi:hypothetical protein
VLPEKSATMISCKAALFFIRTDASPDDLSGQQIGHLTREIWRRKRETHVCEKGDLDAQLDGDLPWLAEVCVLSSLPFATMARRQR